ncbi:radical SAM domain-containing protein (plasmid) [Rhizobium phaseoli]|uniref:radical SAM/SPASM domain-containing protein n=1 Tax=Rhizobium phaseoli TaxID=396 RepID=UPI0007E99450|nr:radical SAM protein [Rhizobium phaseoli]ANL68951.1 radical SAM domain-containing protein [Rhizobium phaseoli]ANL81750.1 radical SAM domain-containing protein [Rhizobium phaseoli]
MNTPDWLSTPQDVHVASQTLQALVTSELSKRVVSENEIKTIYLFLTRKCNLGCHHCYIAGVGPKAKGIDFNLEAIQGLIEQALPNGLRKVKVSGGEPMVHKEFMAVMEYLASCGLKELVFETNGTLFDEFTIEQLSRLPNLTVFISLDHFDPEAHDAFRAKSGAFAKTAIVLQRLGKTDISTVVTTTAYRNNYDKVISIIDLVLGWGIKKHRTLLNIHPMGNARSHEDNAISLEECKLLIGDLLKSPHFESGAAYMTLPPALMPLKYLNGVHTCGWGDNVLGILSNGQVSMCSASYDDPEMIAGNAFEMPLMEIWRNSPFFHELREVVSGEVKGVCGNCVFYPVCRGVCKMSSWSHYGEKDAPYPLCQELYNNGGFPEYALVDPTKDSTYRRGVIAKERRPAAEAPVYNFSEGIAAAAQHTH